MDRYEKINKIIEILEWENVQIIDNSTIQALIFETEYNINDKENSYLQEDIRNIGLTNEDINDFVEFLENHKLMLIYLDNVQGVSFENLYYSTDNLYASDLFKK